MPLPQNPNNYNRKEFCGYGTTFDAKHWLTLEVSGLYGISFSLFIHIYAFMILWYEVILHDTTNTGFVYTTLLLSNLLFYVLYLPIALLAVTSLLQATLTNPGAVPMGARPFVKVRRILSHRTSSTTELLPPPSSSSSTSSQPSGGETVGDDERNRNMNDTLTILNKGSSTANTAQLTSSMVQTVPTTTTTTTATAAAVASTNDDSSSSIRRCYKCNDNYKPTRAHHDSVTGRCIVKFDHYCPWVNNAIGVLNHKFFCLFLFYTALSCVVSLLLLLLHYIHCIPYNHNHNEISEASPVGGEAAVPVRQHETMNDSTTTTRNSVINGHNQEILFDSDGNRQFFIRRILLSSTEENISTNLITNGTDQCHDFFQKYTVIALLIISCIFFIFTVIMILEQIDTIRTGKGKIARMKQRVGASGCTEYETVTEEFNEMFGGTSPHVAWHWFIPIQVRYPKKMKQVVLGYDFNLNTCNPCAPYGMESTTMTSSDIAVSNGCDESVPLSRSSSMNHNINNNNDDDDTMSDVDIESNIASSTRDGLMKSGITSKTKTMKKAPPNIPPPPIPNGEGIFRRELSTDSTLNRRTNRNMNGITPDLDGSPEGMTLVERSKTRIT